MTAEPPPRSPVFVTGCSHSGTTLLRTMLGRHSGIHAIEKESSLFVREISRFKRKRIMASWGKRAREAGRRRWLEKTPNHVFHIPELLSARPDARVVVILRDGRDVAYSLCDRGTVWGDYSDDLAGATQKWVDAVRSTNDVADRVHTVRYEDLVGAPEAAMRGVLEYLGEAFEPAVLRGSASPRRGNPRSEENEAYRCWQAEQPLFDGRGSWRDRMTEAEKALFKEKAGDLLIELGYAPNDDW